MTFNGIGTCAALAAASAMRPMFRALASERARVHDRARGPDVIPSTPESLLAMLAASRVGNRAFAVAMHVAPYVAASGDGAPNSIRATGRFGARHRTRFL
jgi:hypothetical protein